jgi:hypothetical protein
MTLTPSAAPVPPLSATATDVPAGVPCWSTYLIVATSHESGVQIP